MVTNSSLNLFNDRNIQIEIYSKYSPEVMCIIVCVEKRPVAKC